MVLALPTCKNDRCINIVPPSRNPGVRRDYCSGRCARRQNARNYYRREQGIDGTQKMIAGVPHVMRKVPVTTSIAEACFKNHLHSCPNGEINGRPGPCPGRHDPYGKQKLCLLQAVFLEDWNVLRRADKGLVYERELTTAQGTWKVLPAAMAPDLPSTIVYADEDDQR